MVIELVKGGGIRGRGREEDVKDQIREKGRKGRRRLNEKGKEEEEDD